MITTICRVTGLGTLALLALCASAAAENSVATEEALEFGRRIYEEGILSSGEPLTAIVANDVEITGEFVVCAECHRRSGLGASEGESIAPPVVGSLLYMDLQLPVSRPPEPPVQRPAYDYESLAVSIRDGVSSTGEEFSMLMPRYPLNDAEMGYLIAYLDSLGIGPDPGVSETEIHFATIITDDVEPAARKALLDVMQIFIAQKNTETRYETKRASSGPWHKDWVFKPYRKWVMHTWELSGPPSGWEEQLETQYAEQPVFAVLNGLTNGSWEPVHEFCESAELPCLFPTTNLPVVDREDFYTVYLSKGITMEAEAMAQHLADDDVAPGSVIQIYKAGDARSETAAAALGAALGEAMSSVELNDFEPEMTGSPVLVAWLGIDDANTLADAVRKSGAGRVYFSGSLLDRAEFSLDAELKEKAWLAYSTERPDKTARLLLRSTGWFRVKRIYAGDYEEIQANAYFTLKMTGGALNAIRIFFNREFFIESIEHMIDNATYTSVYPRMSLAPEQRFVSKGGAIARFDKNDPEKLVGVADWLVPEF
jgi:hypothetical protein